MRKRKEEGEGKEESSWVCKVRWDFKTEGSRDEGILGGGNGLSNNRRQDGSSVFREQHVLGNKLQQQKGSGGEKGS